MAKYIDTDAFKEKYLYCGYIDDMKKEVFGAFPAPDVAPVTHGEWIEDGYGYNRCSACGWEWDKPVSVSLYRPHCGAKMVEGEIDA